MENGLLKSQVEKGNLTFLQRVEIAIGTAEGIRYLHKFAKPTVIHRDIKSDNILLDGNMMAKVADFGLVKFLQEKEASTGAGGEEAHDGIHEPGIPTLADGELFTQTKVSGTPGYVDPEYARTNIATPKSDVYSFGVVLLELITGKAAVFVVEGGDGQEVQSLANWVLNHSAEVEAVVDPNLHDHHVGAISVMIKLAEACIERRPATRPDMDEVIHRLYNVRSESVGSEFKEATPRNMGFDSPASTGSARGLSTFENSSSMGFSNSLPYGR
eukprot:TRINITY_DN203_c0_g1_i3.p1 TRINITY_DN203_c0_g1~~TRINITY_DN203_c0_g1_i3.p1  ORF type:complete len:271 (+),score=55.10 TRINITY_DN203_c0_g1_i3:130-942(+)